MDRDLIDTADAAVLLGKAVQTLANWRQAGTGPTWIRHRGRVFYRRAELVALATLRGRG